MNFPTSITTALLCIYFTVQTKQNKALMKCRLREHLKTRQLRRHNCLHADSKSTNH